MSNQQQVIICADRQALNARAAELWVEICSEAIRARGQASVALSGGSTPKSLFELMATPEWSRKVDWAKTHLFWGDERAVPADDPQSNYRMAKEAMISKLSIPEANVHRVQTELGAEKAAEAYERTLRQFFPGAAWPQIDLNLLGLGENGHTASLFPHTKLLHENKRWAAAEYIEEVHMDRITMTAPAINHSRQIVFFIAGGSKAEVVREVKEGPRDPVRLPAQLIKPEGGSLLWLLDEDAGSKIKA